MGGAGIVADRQTGRQRQCCECDDIGPADQVERLRAALADGSAGRLFAADADDDR